MTTEMFIHAQGREVGGGSCLLNSKFTLHVSGTHGVTQLMNCVNREVGLASHSLSVSVPFFSRPVRRFGLAVR